MPDRSGPQGSDPLPPPHMGEARRRSGEDLISGLPDEVLHAILVRLRSARAAARTSVLSRRWRRVWPHMPELLLDRGTEAAPPASFLDAVDGALAGCLAPTLERLSISSLPAGRDLTVLKKLVINCKMSTIPPETKEVCEKVRGMYGSNVEVELYTVPDRPDGRRERFY
uniref:F-box domain-containing protein n=1 Tax=Setaria viridis TaxID=4556 RepID=A0A4U6VL56_SETVI|nr:hypothetical protein SEVIR_3G389650v2 [Setaria viridis]